MSRKSDDFDLESFLPYLLNQAAEATSRQFQAVYRDRYGMTRTQWRVLAHLGQFGALTARDICTRSHIEKTKVSRAVAALEADGMLARAPSPEDGRAEILTLTTKGEGVYAELGAQARTHDAALRAAIGPEDAARLGQMLKVLNDLR